jgi:hypothetical protein
VVILILAFFMNLISWVLLYMTYRTKRKIQRLNALSSRVDYYRLAEMELELFGRLLPNANWPEDLIAMESERVRAQGRDIERAIQALNFPKVLIIYRMITRIGNTREREL